MTTTIDKTLTRNLMELYSMEHAENSEYWHIVPSMWGNSLYYTNAGWGRVLHVAYRIWDFFFGTDRLIEQVRNALHYIESTFMRQYEEIRLNFLEFQKLIGDLVEGIPLSNPEDYERCQCLLAKWHDSTMPFIKLALKGKTQKIDQLYLRFTRERVSDPSSIFRNLPQYREMVFYQHVIELVRQIPGPHPPFGALVKLSKKVALFDKEEKSLSEWIERVKAASEVMKIRTFHKGLAAIIHHVEEMHSTKHMREQRRVRQPNIEDLEITLIKRGLNTFFSQIDEKHVKWAESLNCGTELESWGDKYIIDKVIPSGKLIDRMKVFHLQNVADKMIIVAQNRVILPLKMRVAEEESWGVRTVKWYHVSDDGRFAVIEKLRVAVDRIRWHSKVHLVPRDIGILQPIVNQIKFFISTKRTPENLDASRLMIDYDGYLKSSKTLFQGKFDYPLLVDFCRKCAHGNLLVYKHLVEETGLAAHPYHDYFLEVLKRTLRDGAADSAEDIGASRKFRITQHSIINKGELFQKQIIALHEACMEKILTNYDVLNPIVLKEEISAQLFNDYVEGRYIYLFWPKTKERVVAAIVAKMNLKEKTYFNEF